jgi:hypothetical protein
MVKWFKFTVKSHFLYQKFKKTSTFSENLIAFLNPWHTKKWGFWRYRYKEKPKIATLHTLNYFLKHINYFWWFERIISWKMNSQKKDATLVWTIGWTHDCRLPLKHFFFGEINFHFKEPSDNYIYIYKFYFCFYNRLKQDRLSNLRADLFPNLAIPFN